MNPQNLYINYPTEPKKKKKRRPILTLRLIFPLFQSSRIGIRGFRAKQNQGFRFTISYGHDKHRERNGRLFRFVMAPARSKSIGLGHILRFSFWPTTKIRLKFITSAHVVYKSYKQVTKSPICLMIVHKIRLDRKNQSRVSKGVVMPNA